MACSGGLPINVFENESLFRSFQYLSNNTPVDITGGSFVMHIRPGGVGSILTLDASPFISITNPAEGRFVLNIPVSDMQSNLNPDIRYEFALVYVSSGGVYKELFGGTIFVKESVTIV